MKKKLPVILIGISMLVLILLKLMANKNKIDEKNKPVQEVAIRIPVQAITVAEEIQTVELVKTGILAPYKEVKLLSALSGNVQRMLFMPGDRVVQGQTLAIIDTRLLDLELLKAETNTAKLKSDLQTYTELLEGKAATEQKVNEVRQFYRDAQNQEQQLRQQIADGSVKAPTTGIIGTKDVEEGMYVTIGTTIGSIVNLYPPKIKVDLTESQVYQISLGQRVKLIAGVYPDKPFWGNVTFISPGANEAYNYEVEIIAEGSDTGLFLRAGTFVDVDFSKKTKQRILLIPREALSESTQDAFVYIAQNGQVRIRKVKLGTTYGSNVQITDGLHPGDQVITSGQINLKEGSFVKISK